MEFRILIILSRFDYLIVSFVNVYRPSKWKQKKIKEKKTPKIL